MSGWWAAITFDKNNPTIKDYYKKRFIRILPPYYLAVFVIIVLNVFIWGGVRIRDNYGIGYFRYFLALNTLLPSNNYEVWNNLYGLWTMGDFIWFYCFAPFFLRKCDFKKACVILGCCLMARVMLGAAYRIVWSDVDGIDNLDVLIGASPQGVMYHFVEGVMCYHAVKEDKKTAICLFICTLLIIFIITGKTVLIWDVIGILILVAI